MKFIKTILIIVLIIIAFLAGLFFNRLFITGKTIESFGEETQTRAVCNSNNECIDVLIYLRNHEIERIEPVSRVVRFPENWNDGR